MTNERKVSVSYGSFSLTVAGMENPFQTIREITDYFCEVAAKNPKFGSIDQPFSQEISNDEIDLTLPTLQQANSDTPPMPEEVTEKVKLQPLRLKEVLSETKVANEGTGYINPFRRFPIK